MRETESVPVFISCVHADLEHARALETQLANLKRQSRIEVWNGHNLQPGAQRESELQNWRHRAQIVLLLVSPDFIASDDVHEVELKVFLDRQTRQEVKLIPIIVRPTDIKGHSLDNFQCLPRSRKPVTEFDNRDNAWLEIVKELRELLPRPKAESESSTIPSDMLARDPRLPSSAASGLSSVVQSPMRQPRHPFTPGKPVEPEAFVGFETLRDHIQDDFERGQSVFLDGGPRTGKTSLLNRLQHDLLLPQADALNTWSVIITGQDFGEKSCSVDFWKDVKGKCPDNIDSALRGALEALCQPGATVAAIRGLSRTLEKAHTRLVIMVDEFDALLDSSGFSQSFFNPLRDKSTRYLLLLYASRKSRHWCQTRISGQQSRGSEALNLLSERHMAALDPTNASKLLVEIGGLPQEQASLATALAGGNPYLLHWCGKELAEASTPSKWQPALKKLESFVYEWWQHENVERKQAWLRRCAEVMEGKIVHELPLILLWASSVC